MSAEVSEESERERVNQGGPQGEIFSGEMLQCILNYSPVNLTSGSYLTPQS